MQLHRLCMKWRGIQTICYAQRFWGSYWAIQIKKNTSYEISAGSGKPNRMIFLEPITMPVNWMTKDFQIKRHAGRCFKGILWQTSLSMERWLSRPIWTSTVYPYEIVPSFFFLLSKTNLGEEERWFRLWRAGSSRYLLRKNYGIR